MQYPGTRSTEGRLVSRQCIAGLRRVDFVRLYPDGERLRAEAVGVGFRLPVTTPIPVSVAARLIAAGTPSVVLHGADIATEDLQPLPTGAIPVAADEKE